MFTQHKIKQFYQITSLQDKLKLGTMSTPHSNLLAYSTIKIKVIFHYLKFFILMKTLPQIREPLQNLGT